MTNPRRYQLAPGTLAGIEEHPEGSFVHWDDYERLDRKCAALAYLLYGKPPCTCVPMKPQDFTSMTVAERPDCPVHGPVGEPGPLHPADIDPFLTSISRRPQETLAGVAAEPIGECICPTCGIRHGSSNFDGGF